MGMETETAPGSARELTVNVYDIAKDTFSINASIVEFPKIITPAVTHTIVSTAVVSGSCDSDEITLRREVLALSAKLEKAAALILSVLDTARDRGKTTVNWSRAEINTLRKFLFVLSARNSPRWRRLAQYEKLDSEGDHQNDKGEEIDGFRLRHGLRNAHCAWLFSVQHLLETPHWRIPVSDRILPEDKREYEEDMRRRHLAIYETPHQEASSDPFCGPLKCEFPLTESSLGMGEGTNFLLDDDGRDELHFEQKMNLPRPCLLSDHQSADKARAVPLTKIYALSPKIAMVLIHAEVTAFDDLDFSPGSTSNDSVFADFPKTPTLVTYTPPLAEIALAFCNKEPSLWTPEDIQRESDFRHHQILDGRIVYSRLADAMEVAIHKLSSSSVWVLNQVIWQGCKEWIVTEKADGMMEAMWEVREKKDLPDKIKVCNVAKEKTQLKDGEIDEDDDHEEGVARYLPGLRGVFTWGREDRADTDGDEDEDKNIQRL